MSIPTLLYLQIYSGYKRSEDRINFFSAEQVKFKAQFKELAKDLHTTWAPKGCKPVFLLILHGKLVGMVNGVDTPALTLDIEQFCPPPPTDEKE
jgi:hypothetical protein